MKKIELNKSLAYRLGTWKEFEEGAVCCRKSCTLQARRTDAGPLCFGHYIRLLKLARSYRAVIERLKNEKNRIE